MADRPRVGFLGVGWIGRDRMHAMLETGAIDAVAITDPSDEMAAHAVELAPGAERVEGLDQLLALDLDGIVIASPSALHAGQSIAALQRGVAVFCQKPLGRNTAEVRAVVNAARAADRLLAVDLSYRFTNGMTAIRELIAQGELGRIFAIDLVFHNAYGPDKPWFYDRDLSGGGCVMDLGVHLVDLALWALGFPDVAGVTSRLFAQGLPLTASSAVEDYATATIDLADGITVRLACSWRLPIGQEAAISASFHGTEGGASFRNADGGFYRFQTDRHRGTQSEPLGCVEDDWGRRAAAAWAKRLAAGERFDVETERLIDVSAVLDRIYAG